MSSDYAMIREAIPHGNLRFHMMLHEFASDPARRERVSLHWHEEYELLCVTEGSGEMHCNGRSFPVRTGDILFINSGFVHSLSAEPGIPLAFYAIDFGRDLISSYGSDAIQQKYINRQCAGELVFRDHIRPQEALWSAIHPPMEEIRRSCQTSPGAAMNPASGKELLIKADLLRIWYYLCANPATNIEASDRRNDRAMELTKKILRYIRESCAGSLSLSDLAREFSMSEGQFCRFFKSQINMTAVEYINYCRIGEACELLRSGKALSISDAALSAGYSNISYFNRMFRRYMHCTPGEFVNSCGTLL